jgi:type I restriction enzyme S subunit
MGQGKFKINELGTINRGRSRHRPRNDVSLYGGEYPFVQTGDVKAANFYLRDFGQTYNDKGLAQSKIWPKGTLLITIAANIAETAILDIDACFPDSIIGFTPYNEIADARYVKYYFDYIKLKLQAISQGTTQDNMSMEKLLSMPFNVHSFVEQTQIASILSAYDKLIDNNNQRITLLTQIAEEIYKEWFVRLRFPGHEQTRIVDGLPEGWELRTFGEIYNIKYGKTLPKKKIAETGKYPVYGAGGIIGYYNQAVIQNKVALVTCRGNGSGTVWRTREPAYVTNNSFMLIPNKVFGHFPYFFNEQLATHSNVKGVLSGSAQPQITIEGLSTVKGTVPNKLLITKYTEIMRPIYTLVDVLVKKNKILKQTRDLLLPRLISGKLSVEHLLKTDN